MKDPFSFSVRHFWCLVFVTALAGTAHADGPGFALGFNGIGNYVSVPHTAALNTYPLTVMAWVNITRGTMQKGLVNKYVAGSLNGWQVFLLARWQSLLPPVQTLTAKP